MYPGHLAPGALLSLQGKADKSFNFAGTSAELLTYIPGLLIQNFLFH